MGKSSRKDRPIKVVIMNPECIPIAQERLMKFLYEEYMEAIRNNEITITEDGKMIDNRVTDKV